MFGQRIMYITVDLWKINNESPLQQTYLGFASQHNLFENVLHLIFYIQEGP